MRRAVSSTGSDRSTSPTPSAEDCEVTEKTIQRTLRKAKKVGILRLMCRELGPLPRIYSLDVPYLATYPLTHVGRLREEHLGAGP